MGLGKTMQAITAIRLLMRSAQARRVLLVCPKPLIPNWKREFKLWAEELPVIILEGDASSPPDAVDDAGHQRADRQLRADVARLGRIIDVKEFPQFDLLVLDEAQRVKNRESRTAQVARSIPRRRSWALTGTPIENRPEELVSLYEFMEVVPPRAECDIKQLQTALEDLHPPADEGPRADRPASAARPRRVPRADAGPAARLQNRRERGDHSPRRAGRIDLRSSTSSSWCCGSSRSRISIRSPARVPNWSGCWPKWRKSPKATARPSSSASGPNRSIGSTSGWGLSARWSITAGFPRRSGNRS